MSTSSSPLGRDSYAQQVGPDRHHVTAATTAKNQILSIGTWKVRTLQQIRQFDPRQFDPARVTGPSPAYRCSAATLHGGGAGEPRWDTAG